MHNPYSAPIQGDLSENGSFVLNERVYSHGQMMYGTFLGSILCSSFMVKKNFLVFGLPERGRKAFWSMIGIAVVMICLSVFIPTNIPGLILTVVSMFSLSKWHGSQMAAIQNDFMRRGGKRQSNWKVFGLVMASIAIIFGLAIAIGIVVELVSPGLLE